MAKTTVNVKRLEPGDLLIHEESSIVCRESGTVEAAATVAAGTELIGQPVELVAGQWTLVAAASIANVEGVILDASERMDGIGAGTASNFEMSILARGPAAVNKDRLAKVDATGVAIDNAAYVAALEALGIVSRDVPPESSKQTT